MTVVLGDLQIALNAGELEKRQDAGVEHLLRVALSAVGVHDDADALHTRIILYPEQSEQPQLNSTMGPRSERSV